MASKQGVCVPGLHSEGQSVCRSHSEPRDKIPSIHRLPPICLPTGIREMDEGKRDSRHTHGRHRLEDEAAALKSSFLPVPS